MHIFSPEQIDFIRHNAKGISNAEIAEKFNRYFGLNLSAKQIKSCKNNHKISSGLDGRFKPGHIPFNKGKKGQGGWPPTQFKKGNRPHNYKPIGTERINADGYTEVKIQDCEQPWKNYKGKHILTWEKHNGPVPDGHAVIFGDGNKRNFDINNLILVSRAQLLILNRQGLIQSDAELTKTGVVISKLHQKISSRKKGSARSG